MSSVEPSHEPARAAVGAGKPWKEAVVHGVRLAYDDEGVGPPLLCLHAIGHGAGDFSRLRAELRSHYRVIALDWPGQGRSGSDSRPASAARYADLLEGFIEALGLGPVVLVGNSIGGAAAIRYTALHRGRVRALVLANPGGLVPHGLVTRLFTRALARFFRAGARGASWFRRAFTAFYARILPGEPAAEQRSRIIASADEIAPLLAEAWASFGERSADLRALAAEVNCPVLVTWATLDPVNPLWINRGGIRRFPDARLATFRAGHAPFLETPREFDAALSGFLSGALAAS